MKSGFLDISSTPLGCKANTGFFAEKMEVVFFGNIYDTINFYV